MQTIPPDRPVYYFRILCIMILFAGAAAYVAFTIHWQWLWDTSVMHYIVLLLDHGKVPYKDIYDINMPGAYLTERWAIDIFGGGDLGWRFYDFTLLGTMTIAMIVIAKPYDWLAGLFSGVLFSLFVGSLGPFQTAQRDEVMTVLIFIAYAFLFTALRKNWPVLMVSYGLAFGIAVLIKPTVLPFALLLLLFPFFVLKRRGQSPWPYLLFALAGFAIALGILLDFLLPHHAFGPFFFILSKLVPYYSSLAHAGWHVLVSRSLPKSMYLLLLSALILAFTSKHRASWEMWAVRMGVLFGGFSFFIQRKGYDYHRIPYLTFALLWVGLELTAAMKDRGQRRELAVATMAIAVFLLLPFEALKIRLLQQKNPAAYVLAQDLQRLGGEKLQGKVQCLDLVGGCLSALYRLGLVQSTGFTGDLQFFGPDDGNVVPYYRKILLDDFKANPPEVIILSNEWYQTSSYSFDKLNTWPEFRDYLNSTYRLDATRGVFYLFGYPMAFRIYVLRK